jgi:hypothetical protein
MPMTPTQNWVATCCTPVRNTQLLKAKGKYSIGGIAAVLQNINSDMGANGDLRSNCAQLLGLM